MEHNVDALFEQAVAEAHITPAEMNFLKGDIPIWKHFFLMGYVARDQEPRKQLAALLRAPS